MAKYRVDTDKGSYIVETEDSNIQASTQPMFSSEQEGRQALGVAQKQEDSARFYANHPYFSAAKNTAQDIGIGLGNAANGASFNNLKGMLSKYGVTLPQSRPEAAPITRFAQGTGANLLGNVVSPISKVLGGYAMGAKTVGGMIGRGALAGAAGGAIYSPEDPTNMLQRGVQAVGGAAAGGAFGSIPALMKIKEDSKLAGKLVNSLIRPSHKNYMFGKNPGQGVAKEGIFATSINDLHSKIDQRLGELNLYAKNLRQLPENSDKRIDLTPAFSPIFKTLERFSKSPHVHSAKIKELENIFDDLSKSGVNLKNATVEDAYTMKEIVKDMQKWHVQSNSDNVMNSTLKSVYHLVDKGIDTAIPELEKVNSRIADLISASQAVSRRIDSLNSQEPMTLYKLADLPFSVLRSTPVKTGLAKILSTKYGILK